MSIEFQKFSKIPRIRGLRMCITEKLDGTNAQIYVPDDPDAPLLVGSRNRWITPGKSTDNYDFALWASDHDQVLRRLGQGRHFGEWWGVGIARRYGLTERRWSLFQHYRFREGLPEGIPSCVGVVPVLYEGEFSMDAVEAAKAKLITEGSVASPGFMSPEGIVVTVTGGPEPLTWKFTFDGDAKDAPSPEAKGA